MRARGSVVLVAGVAIGGWVWATALAAPPSEPVAAVAAPRAEEPRPVASLVIGKDQAKIVSSVSELLERLHFTGAKLDDAMSERWFDEYLKSLDPQRDILLQTDVDGFLEHRDELDDYARAAHPRLELAVDMYKRYQQRQQARAQYAVDLLSRPLDLTNAEAYRIDRHEADVPWPATDAEANEIWRKRVENDVIVSLLDGKDDEETVRKRLSSRYQRWMKNEAEKESMDVLQDYLGALGQAYDPHTDWFAPAKNDQFDISITNSVEGIGAQLEQDDEGYTTVSDVIPGGPAFKSGKVVKEDRILAVAQQGAEPVDVVNLRLDKVVALIRGAKGTEVTLHMQHADGTIELITLVRDRVLLEESAAEGTVEEVQTERGPLKLGVVNLPTFYIDPEGRRAGHGASEDVQRAIVALQQQGVEGLVLDLRSNGGGSLTEAVEVAGLFLPGGPVVQVRFREGQVETLHDQDPTVAWAGPLVVMVDAFSASASEIVAGALQDYGRAVIVGDQATHGKGSVQQVIELDRVSGFAKKKQDEDDGPGSGSLKVTVQKFYRVSGGSTQIRGVQSDVVLPSGLDGYDEIHESALDWALPWDQIPPAPHVRAGEPQTMLPELVSRSQARVTADEDFQKLQAALALRDKIDAEQEVSLVLEERRAEQETRKALLGLDEEEPDVSKLTTAERKALRRKGDFRLDEGLGVLADVVTLGDR